VGIALVPDQRDLADPHVRLAQGLRPSLGPGAPGARVRDASAWRPSERQSPSPARSCR
jgi:hypothetical protein